MIDYFIVCTVQPNDIVQYVGARNDLDEDTATKKLTRTQVITYIEQGKVVYTAYRKNAQLVKGNKVRVYIVSGTKYIKTEKNSLKEDNLDNLRTCRNFV